MSDIENYIASLSSDQALIVRELQKIVRDNLQEGFEEQFSWGMIAYEVPLARSGKTYNGKPLMYAAIGAQKHHVALYLCALYCADNGVEAFKKAYLDAGVKVDMGKSCLRVKREDQIVSNLIAETIARYSIDDFLNLSKRN